MALTTARKPKVSNGIDYTALAIPKGGKRGSVDKTVLTIGEPERIRDTAYRESAKHRACECCGRNDASVVGCHLNDEQAGGKGLKAGDDQMLFLCGACHRLMDTDPRGILVNILERMIRPRLYARYQNWRRSPVLWTPIFAMPGELLAPHLDAYATSSKRDEWSVR
jgi:hypothetical protein